MCRAVLLVTVACTAATAFSADMIYMHDYDTGALTRFDTATGLETLIGYTGVDDFMALAAAPVPVPRAGGGFWPAGTLFGLQRDGGVLYVINPVDASLTLIGSDPFDLDDCQGLAFRPDGTLYAMRDETYDGEFYRVSTVTADGTYVGHCNIWDLDGLTSFPFPMSVQGFGTAQAGDFLACNGFELYHINPSTLEATYIGSLHAHQTLDFSPAGTLYGHDWNGGLYRLTLDPLGDTRIANVTQHVDGMAVIPEPAAALLLGSVCAVALRRR